MFQQITPEKYNYLWLAIHQNKNAKCAWGTNYVDNCAYVEQLLNEAMKKKSGVGIYSTIDAWTEIMGSAGACNLSALGYSSPLWYAYYDN